MFGTLVPTKTLITVDWIISKITLIALILQVGIYIPQILTYHLLLKITFYFI